MLGVPCPGSTEPLLSVAVVTRPWDSEASGVVGRSPVGARFVGTLGLLVSREIGITLISVQVKVVLRVVVTLQVVIVVLHVVHAIRSGKAPAAIEPTSLAMVWKPLPTTSRAPEIKEFALATSAEAIACASCIAADTMEWTVKASPSTSIAVTGEVIVGGTSGGHSYTGVVM